MQFYWFMKQKMQFVTVICINNADYFIKTFKFALYISTNQSI